MGGADDGGSKSRGGDEGEGGGEYEKLFHLVVPPVGFPVLRDWCDCYRSPTEQLSIYLAEMMPKNFFL
jgi:hypothetical protein